MLNETVSKLVNANKEAHCQPSPDNTLHGHVSSIGLSLFEGLGSKSGVDALKSAVSSSNIESYITSKPEIIATLTIGILVILLAIGYGCFASVKACISNKKTEAKLEEFSISNNNNNNSGNKKYHFLSLPKPNKKLCSFLVSLCGLVMLFMVAGIVVVLFQSNTSISTTMCNTWETVNGFFYGSTNMKVLPGVANDWAGSFKQEDTIKTLFQRVVPGTGNNPVSLERQNILYKRVYNEFYGPQGLTVKLQSLNAAAQQSLQTYLLASSAVLALMEKPEEEYYNLTTSNFTVSVDKMNLEYMQQDICLLMATLVGAQMTSTLKLLDTTFSTMLQASLSNEASLVQEARQAANSSLVMIDDANELMLEIAQVADSFNGLLIIWTVGLYLLIAISVLSAVIAIFYISFVIICNKKTQSRTFKAVKRRNALGNLIHSGLLTAAAILLLIGTVLLSIGIAGKDTCSFVQEDLLTNGDWNYIPPKLRTSKSNTTNINNLLNVCLKKDGHGDIVADYGLRVLVEKLDHHAKALEQETIETMEKNMDKDNKFIGLMTIAGIMKDNGRSLVTVPAKPFTTFSINVRTPVTDATTGAVTYKTTSESVLGNQYTDILHMTAEATDKQIKGSCFERLAIGFLKDQDLITEIVMGDECSVYPTYKMSTLKQGIQTLELHLEKAFKAGKTTYRAVCPLFLYAESKCEGLISPDILEANILVLNATSKIERSDVTFYHNPLADEQVAQAILHFKESSQMKEVEETIQFILRLFSFEYNLGRRISAASIQSEIDKLSGGIPIPWDLIPPSKSFPGCLSTDTCTFKDLHMFFLLIGDSTADTVMNIFQKMIAEIETFVESVVIAVTQEQVQLARSILVNSNCQYLGSALEKAAVPNLCSNVLPNMGLLGVFVILLAVATAVLAFFLKAQWVSTQIVFAHSLP